jgi:hypothetical protein
MRVSLANAVDRVLRRSGYVLATDGARTPPDMEREFLALYERCAPHTMTSIERMYALWQAVRHLRGVAGGVVECGVWRGGSSMLAALTLAESNDERMLWLYDTFEGMSDPTDRDVDIAGTRVAENWEELRAQDGPILARATLAEVRANMGSTGVPEERIRYVPGKVEDTIPHHAPARIALLRLDTDWYQSTRHELEHLWPRLEPGGVLIVDDYGHWAGAREAVDEFFAAREDAPLLSRIDYTGRIGVKR